MKLLIIEDDRPLAESLRQNLSGFDPSLAFTPEQGERSMREQSPSVVLLDLGFPDDVSVGLSLLTRLLQIDPKAKILVTTGFGSREVGARAVERGAYAYLEKPIRDFQALRVILEQANRICGLEGEIRTLQGSAVGFPGWVGSSPKMERVFGQIREVASMRVTVLLYGESGTGKEQAARALQESGRPFVVLDCAALQENLVEDKLFGHEKGAFTGAVSELKGALETADGGTLFIDEIGELPLSVQPKLLRFLQNKTFQRVGSHRDIAVDVRVVAATHRDLKKEVEAARFREDLYWRLNVYTITLPPLRERLEDIPLLVSHLLKKHAAEYRKEITRVAPAALAKLSGYDWPGNVRELENLIQRAMLVASGSVLLPQHLNPFEGETPLTRLSDLEAHWKVHWIRETLARQGGRLEAAAGDLGISKRQLQRYTKEFGIDWKRFLAFLMLGLFFQAGSAWTQPKKQTLEDLIALALRARPELRLAESRREEAESWKLEARSASLPHLDLGVSTLRLQDRPSATFDSFDTEATIDMRPVKENFPVLGAGPDAVTVPFRFNETHVDLLGETIFSTQLTLRQALFSGGRIREKKKQASLGLALADLDQERARRGIVAGVKERYLKSVYAGKGARLLGKGAKRLLIVEKFLKNLSQHYVPREGEKGVSELDWLKASTLASQILAKREEAVTQADLAREELGRYCGLEESSILFEEKPLSVSLPPFSEIQQRLESSPELKLVTRQVEMARSEVKFAKGALYPEVAAVGFFSYTLDRFPSEPMLAGGGVTLRFPLFDGLERIASLNRSRALYKQASFEQEQAETDLKAGVESLYRLLEQFPGRIGYLEKASRQAARRRELASESYLLDFGDYKDYLDALQEEVETEGLRLATELDYHLQAVRLESLIGDK